MVKEYPRKNTVTNEEPEWVKKARDRAKTSTRIMSEEAAKDIRSQVNADLAANPPPQGTFLFSNDLPLFRT